MNYFITNANKKVYIKLNSMGTPETCSKMIAQRFEYSKARNILDHLPKTLKRFHFRLEPIPEITIHDDSKNVPVVCNTKPKRKEKIVNADYKPSERITEWLTRVKTCNDLASDASIRKDVLLRTLSDIDKKKCNCEHKIELEKWENACDGYRKYKELKTILEERRQIKDELIVVETILSTNLESMATNHIEKTIKGLSERKYAVREV